MSSGTNNGSGKYNLLDLLGKHPIEIPRVQRAYVQGRESEEMVRKRFLGALFHTLRTGADLDLNFVFGSTRNGRLELLDGQQRLTTLWLLHWYLYVCIAEKKEDKLSNFKYLTRATTNDFLQNLLTHTGNMAVDRNARLSDKIKQRGWYTYAMDQDASVRNMLNMLDAIHHQYEGNEKLGNLSKICFYVPPESLMPNPDDLYLKMNTRALSLTPFECFKADLLGYIKRRSATCSLHWDYPKLMDGEWLDYFWNQVGKEFKDKGIYEKDSECNRRYLRFFFRFFAHRCAVQMEPYNEKDEAWTFFNKRSDRQTTKQADDRIPRYLGFDHYEKFLDGSSLLHHIGLVMHKLMELSELPDDCRLFKAHWGEAQDSQGGTDLFGTGYTQEDAVRFSAFCDYVIAASASCDIGDLRLWMRVVWNIVENSDVDNEEKEVSLIKALNKLAYKLAPACGKREFYTKLAEYRQSYENRAIQHEALKASLIARPDDGEMEKWEAAMINAEKHPFFRGLVFFVGEAKTLDLETFNKRLGFVSPLFDVNGIVEKYRKGGHLLLRAMLSRLNTKDLLMEVYLKECKSSDHGRAYPKAFLRKDRIQRMFCDLADKGHDSDMFEGQSDDAVWDAIGKAESQGMTPEWQDLYHALVNLPVLLDRIAEDNGRSYRVSESYGQHPCLYSTKYPFVCIFDRNRDDMIREILGKDGSMQENGNRGRNLGNEDSPCFFWMPIRMKCDGLDLEFKQHSVSVFARNELVREVDYGDSNRFKVEYLLEKPGIAPKQDVQEPGRSGLP